MDIPATLEGRSGHGVERRRGRSSFGGGAGMPEGGAKTLDTDARAALARAQAGLLELGGVKVRQAHTETGDGAIHHLEVGRGRPLVLLHGAGGGGANWYRVLKALSEERRVLAPDLPGFGLSDPIPLRAPLGACAAERIDMWMRARGLETCDVAGTSFGALIALRLAQRGRVARLVLLDAAGLGRALPWPVRIASTRAGGAVLMRHSTPAGIRAQLRLLMTAERLDAEHEDALVAYLQASAAMDTTRQLARALLQFGGLSGQREVLRDDELRALGLPVLLVWGARDRFTPLSHARRAERMLPDARLVVIPDAGHSPNWERPGAVLDAMRSFLPLS